MLKEFQKRNLLQIAAALLAGGISVLGFLESGHAGGKIFFVLFFLLYSSLVCWYEIRKWGRIEQNVDEIFTCIFNNQETWKGKKLSSSRKLFLLASETPRIIEQEYVARVIEKQTKLRTLQEQINPHFLYNTLESIRGEALMEDAEQIAEMTEMLSNMFRYSISLKKDVVYLYEELENIQNYFAIQKYRFGSRIDLKVDCADDELLKCCIPKLLLQPIVENAVLHGLENSAKRGMVEIGIKGSQEFLLLSFLDNGEGMEEAVMDQMNRMFEEKLSVLQESDKKSIALQNVSQRIKLYYGDQGGIHVYSVPHVGTEFVLRLPKRYRSEQ